MTSKRSSTDTTGATERITRPTYGARVRTPDAAGKRSRADKRTTRRDHQRAATLQAW